MTRFAFVFLISAILLPSAQALHAGDGHQQGHAATADHHHHGSDAGLSLNHGQRWATDAPLRSGMMRISEAYAAAASSASGSEARKALPASIDAVIGQIIRDCRLVPKADASLHVLIGRLGQASAKLARDHNDDTGLRMIDHTLSLYLEYFDDPELAAREAPSAPQAQ
ncbi:hypothetical protein [Pseudomarimonas arenosa]|uniref:DnrO protein n=1 Tax=Pseudomarimonas arenosa TaxID=2774145 RepID=A0AAW3ZR59_9GAMM|nr:hypothetical protein [Pseudomarimonas arenosa]MBD8527099.1 hypothetical protein [Pseudomarimonas arenosa]